MFKSLYLVLLASLAAIVARADTEIVNFHLPLSKDTTVYPPLDTVIHTISPFETVNINLTDISPEQWFSLDWKDQQDKYKSWTLRASWPASSPTRIQILPPHSPGFLLIHASPLSPRFPYHPPLSQYLPSFLQPLFTFLPRATQPVPAERKLDTEFETPLHLTLEPLLLGVLPYTALPAVGLILVVVVVAGLGVPYVIKGLEGAGNWVDGRRRKEGVKEE
ncbi:hypothetical protein B9479_004211 [Cryptococcus floricola]|uniref:GPI transamidase component PIG-T n=1 Tax=Cryptococcus floricola TaxID=2591691 RepID=A0A5D3AX40_9TREE|nr:hypothetical protein B9479_004211 [Cryptococcus floricola]